MILISFLGAPYLISFEEYVLYATLATPALLLFLWLLATICIDISSSSISEAEREWRARSGSWWLRAIIGWILAFTLVIYVPQWIFLIPGLSDTNPVTLGAGGGLLGIITGLFGYWSKNGATLKQRAKGLAAATGLRILDLAAILFSIALMVALCFLLSWALNRFHSLGSHYKKSQAFVTTETVLAAKATENSAKATHAIINGISDGAKTDIEKAALSTSANATTKLSARMKLIADKMVYGIEDKPNLIYTGSIEQAIRANESTIKATDAIIAAAKLRKEQGDLKDALVSASGAVASTAKAIEIAAKGELNEEKNKPIDIYVNSLKQDNGWILFVIFILLICFSFLMAWLVEVNTFSLHSMYGNRLVRAYLGATRDKRNPDWFTGFDSEDNIHMSELISSRTNNEKPLRLFHIINLALNIAKPSDGRLEWQQRKAEPFTVSPLHAGNPYVGYVPVENYSGSQGKGISVGRAMTISGAAASPNMGYHTSSAVAFVMTFFNIRLGWWLPNPHWQPTGKPKWFIPTREALLNEKGPKWGLLYEALSQSSDTSKYVYLSDGGHFENLGLYEMARRRCAKIMVVDATCDPQFKFDDLEDAIRKIRIDFGVQIQFKNGLPTPEYAKKSGCHYAIGEIYYPAIDNKNVDFSLDEFTNVYTIKKLCDKLIEDDLPIQSNTVVELNKLLEIPDLYSKIKQNKYQDRSKWLHELEQSYNDQKNVNNLKKLNRAVLEEFYPQEIPKKLKSEFVGEICYIKPVISCDEPLDVMRYADRNKEFPQQSTADQFFDEAQFESYRMLGLHSLEELEIRDDGWLCKKHNICTESTSMSQHIQSSNKSECRFNAGNVGEGGSGIISSLSNAAQSMGQGALIASAITIGGVLGVTGAVTLRNPTVTLKPGAEVRINKDEGVPLTISQNDKVGLNIDDKDKELLKPINLQSAELKELLGKVNALIGEVTNLIKHDHPPTAHDHKDIDKIKERIELLEKLFKEETFSSLKDIKEGIIGKGKTADIINENTDKNKKLAPLLEQLNTLNDKISELESRRNIRGIEGGSK